MIIHSYHPIKSTISECQLRFFNNSIYHVAQELNYFKTNCGVVPDGHGVVPDRHTDHYSFSVSSINTTSVSDETSSSTISNQECSLAFKIIIF